MICWLEMARRLPRRMSTRRNGNCSRVLAALGAIASRAMSGARVPSQRDAVERVFGTLRTGKVRFCKCDQSACLGSVIGRILTFG